MADIKFKITKSIGILSEGSKGWQKEINLVSWNERNPKIDINYIPKSIAASRTASSSTYLSSFWQ